jgi:hypothetical protein
MDKIEIAARNKKNYLKAKEAFNNKRIDECVLFTPRTTRLNRNQVRKDEK